jgi:cytoskeletal protein RodZ
LKKHRLDRQISLMDISAATRINLRFLEAMEEGKFSVLPATYIRAFLREYAEFIGLDPEATLRSFEKVQEDGLPAGAPASYRSAGERPAAEPPLQKFTAPLTGARVQMLFLLALLMVVGVLVVYMLQPAGEEVSVSTTQEIPFDRVVEESMAALPTAQPATPVTVSPPPSVPPPPDTLVLQMQTTDSVWVLMVIDGERTEEYLFPPNRRHTWRATSEFVVTLGRAGAASFRLNTRDLGTLGRAGAVVRNVRISRQMLEPSAAVPSP